MKLTNPLPFLVLPLCLSFLAARPLAAQSDPGKAIIILDASGSMWGQIEGKPKIQIAREVIAGLMSTLDPELEIGLMAYGHREKGNCDDIELLVAPGKGDRSAFLAEVNRIIPKGMTPLTSAVEQAAQFLRYEEEAASVILISDGLETCDRDPCSLAGELAAKGIRFTTHIVAFDLTSEESDSIRCLADETGGKFLQAQDAGTLKDALEMAVEALQRPAAEVMPAPRMDPATLTAPASVPAGSGFAVEWTGPDNEGDYLTIIAKEADDTLYGNYAYTRNGSPLTLTAPVKPGMYEVRYRMGGGGRDVLGRVDVEVVPVEATLDAPAEVVAGSGIKVTWAGPDNKGDYVTIVPKEAEEGTYESYAYTRDGSPAGIRALSVPGPAEIRYVTGQGQITLARRDIIVQKAEVLVSGPEFVDAGDRFPADWVGPANQGDYVTIVKRDAAEGVYNDYVYTKNSEDGKVELKAPEEPGEDYELRYVEGQDGKTLARYPLAIRPVTASVEGPGSAVSGSEVEIKWIGPRYPKWYVTIVEQGAKEGSYTKYFYTSEVESPTKLQAPELVGPCEIRFISEKGKTFASTPIELVAAKAGFVEVPETLATGQKFRVKWEGPDNARDYITIVEADAEDGKYGAYIYVENGPDQDLTAPDEPGSYEIRYVTSQKRAVLARVPVKVEKK